MDEEQLPPAPFNARIIAAVIDWVVAIGLLMSALCQGHRAYGARHP